MRNRFLIIFGFVCVLSLAVGLRELNNFLAEDILSTRPFRAQVSPGPNQALFFYKPNSGTFGPNKSFVVDMRVNSSVAITSVKAYLIFDTTRLAVISVDTSQSAFGNQWEQTFDNAVGIIRFQRTTPAPGKSGDNLIAKITFQTKSTGGNAVVGYDVNCFAASNPTCLALKPDVTDTNVLVSSPTATFTIDSTPPSAPTNISYTPNPNNTGMHTVSWNAATDTGGSGVATYEVQRSISGTNDWTRVTPASGVTGTSFAEPFPGAADGVYVYRVGATDNAGNTGDFSSNTNTVLVDKTAPQFVADSGQPTGTLPAGTTSETLRITTIEAATCNYALNADPPYDDPTRSLFTTTGGTSHSQPLSGLINNTTYNYYVRCQDALNNKNSAGRLIEFRIGSPPSSPPLRSNPQPTGTLAHTTTQATLSIETDEQATCRYATSPNTLYGDMQPTTAFTMGVQLPAPNNNFPHTKSVPTSAGTAYTFYVRCIDSGGVANTTDDPIAFQVAANPDPNAPSRSKPQPAGTLAVGTTQATLSLETDESATCRYSQKANTAFADMSQTQTFTSAANADGTFAYSLEVTGLSNGTSYTYYVRCSDTSGNTNEDDFSIQFSVAAPPGDDGPVSPGGPPPGPPAPPGGLKGDCNSDKKVNIIDLSILLSNWQKTTSTCDLNGDSRVTIIDFSIMLSNWTR